MPWRRGAPVGRQRRDRLTGGWRGGAVLGHVRGASYKAIPQGRKGGVPTTDMQG